MLYVCIYNVILHIHCEVKDTNAHTDTKLPLKASEVPKHLHCFWSTNYEMGKSIRKLIIPFLCNFGKQNVHSTTQY